MLTLALSPSPTVYKKSDRVKENSVKSKDYISNSIRILILYHYCICFKQLAKYLSSAYIFQYDNVLIFSKGKET